MIIGPLFPLVLTPLNAELRPIAEGRPIGRHWSEVTGAMRAAAGLKMGGVEGEDPVLRQQAGFLWERALEYVKRGVPWHEALEQAWREYRAAAEAPYQDVELQPNLVCDGILLTPDGIVRDAKRVESYKFTWRSMHRWEEDAEVNFWPWLIAEMGYLHAVSVREQEPYTTVRFYIFWAMGDYSYKPGRGPQATRCDVEFTSDEIEDNWRTGLRYKDWLDSQKEGK